MRILITGASGLLGLNLALEASSAHEVFGVVNQHRLHEPGFSVIQQDLLANTAVPDLLDLTRPEWVVHCAAQANIDLCEADQKLARQLNAELPGRLAHETSRRGLHLMHISTDAVFDGQRGEYDEEDLPNPMSVYASTKLEGEQMVLAEDPSAIVARVNLFGWSLNGKRSLAEFFYTNLSAGRRVKGFTDVYFCPLLVNDLAKLLLQMLDLELKGVYHVVSRDCTTKYHFGLAIANRFGLSEELIEPESLAQSGLIARRSPRLTLKSEKLATALGRPLPDWVSGIDRFHALWRSGFRDRLRAMA